MNIRDYALECTMCHYYYVEHHMSLREVSREVQLSPMTVIRRLEALKDFNAYMYSDYLGEKRRRKNG
jgi:hypothetical protein